MRAIPLDTAATELGVAPGTLRRWIREGAPVARQGARGRGRQTLVCVADIDTWRRSDGAERAMLNLAARVPELIADAVDDAYRDAHNVNKHVLAGVMVATWYRATTQVLDHMRELHPSVPDVDSLPSRKIDRIRSIFARFGTVGAISAEEP